MSRHFKHITKRREPKQTVKGDSRQAIVECLGRTRRRSL